MAEGVLASSTLESMTPWLQCSLHFLHGRRCFGFEPLRIDSSLTVDCLLHFYLDGQRWFRFVPLRVNSPLVSSAYCTFLDDRRCFCSSPLGSIAPWFRVLIALLDKHAKFAVVVNFANLHNFSLRNAMLDVCNFVVALTHKKNLGSETLYSIGVFTKGPPR